MSYPEYKEDVNLPTGVETPVEGDSGQATQTRPLGKVRMKPPLCSMRLGELFGNDHFNQTGFIKSLSYSWPDNSPWEYR